MEKCAIIEEIRRTAAENGGKPLGWRRFATETGIRESEWLGKHWARWSEALREAGLAPNVLTAAYEEEELVRRYVLLAQRLGRLPANADLRLASQTDPTIPSDKTFARLGSKAELNAKAAAYALKDPQFSGVAEMLARALTGKARLPEAQARSMAEEGFVYLIKSGRYFKIGRTNAAGRREREIALQLPEKAATVHLIRTDDPVGIEAYWHKRFEAKRKNGEWFDLSVAEVAAFKRRRFM